MQRNRLMPLLEVFDFHGFLTPFSQKKQVFYLVCSLLFLQGSCRQPTVGDNKKVGSVVVTPTTNLEIKGIDFAAPPNPINQTDLASCLATYPNFIALMPYSFCKVDDPKVKYNSPRQWWGERDEGIIACVKLIHASQIKVMIKPHIWMDHGLYTGKFSLNDSIKIALWEKSYSEYILHNARLADSLEVEMFCIGTELGQNVKERPLFWLKLIQSVKDVFHGKLTYAANWDDYEQFPYWDSLDFIGVDAYFPISKLPNPSLSELKKGWNLHLPKLAAASAKFNKKIIFTEFGYRSVEYCANQPWLEENKPQSEQAQANAHQALFESLATQKWFAGGFVWKWYADNSFEKGDKYDYSPQGKQAAEVINQWYKKTY
jgi:hypothetical protein